TLLQIRGDWTLAPINFPPGPKFAADYENPECLPDPNRWSVHPGSGGRGNAAGPGPIPTSVAYPGNKFSPCDGSVVLAPPVAPLHRSGLSVCFGSCASSATGFGSR